MLYFNISTNRKYYFNKLIYFYTFYLYTNSFIEIHGDRYFGNDKSIVGGISSIDGETFIIIGHQKGRDANEKVKRNFGMSKPEGYQKALRVIRLGEKFILPILKLLLFHR